MEIKYTSDFHELVFELLQPWSGKKCILMISGGSILDCFVKSKIKQIETSKWQVFYSDERVDSIDLNYNKSIGFINNIDATIHQMNIYNDVDAVIKDYNDTCLHIDLALLGVGEDGHIASIFPNSKILDSQEYFVYIEDSPYEPKKRITTTIKFFNDRVDELVFIIPPKKGVIKKIKGPCDDIKSRLKNNFTVYLDKSLESE